MYISLATELMNQRLQLIANALSNTSSTMSVLPASASTLAKYANANNFTIVIFSGSIPKNADTVLGSDNVELATINVLNSYVQQPSNGTLVISGEPLTSSPATNSGVATFARIYNENGIPVMDCDVGISGSVFILVSTSITSGLIVTITSMAFSEYNS